jgi:hypothetical protein
MFLTELSESDFNDILNYSFDSDPSNIQSVFLAFKLKLFCQIIGLTENSKNIDFAIVTPTFIKQLIDKFNEFYMNNTKSGYQKIKQELYITEQSYEDAPDIALYTPFINSLSGNKDKALNLYAFGLISIWDQSNTWSFMAHSDTNYQHGWFASFYMFSNSYFELWEVINVENSIKLSKSKQSSSAASYRHIRSNKTRVYAIESYSKLQFRSVKQGVVSIANSVIEYGKTVGFHFSNEFQARDTIYKWILDNKKTNT